MKNKVFILSFLLLFLFIATVSAAPLDDVSVSADETIVLSPEEIALNEFYAKVNNKDREDELISISIIKAPKDLNAPVVTEDGTPIEVEETLYFGLSGNELLFSIEDPLYTTWLESVLESVREDAKQGLDVLASSEVTLDHIKLSVWGEFLNKYYGKTNANFPIGSITLEYGNYSLTFNNSKEAKEYFMNYFIDSVVREIVLEAQNYPVKRYSLQIDSGSLLKDYVCDLNSVREIKLVYPFDGVSTYVFSNTGSYYGLNLGKEYVDILRGYLEGDKMGYDRPVEGDIPGCVNVLAYITLLRNVSGDTLSDKVLSDFTLYENLAICLDDKTLIDTVDMTTTNNKLDFNDYKLNPETLVLAPISDTVVIIQPTYLECINYAGVNAGLGRILDATEFISTGSPYLTTQTEQGEVKIPISYFCDENGYIDTKLGNAPFLVYYSSHTPYDVMINWGYNNSGSYLDSEGQEKFIKAIETDMKAQGLSAEFDAYVKAAGKMTNTTKLIIKVVIGVVALLIIVGVVVFIVLKTKKKGSNPISNNNDVLFEDNDFGFDDNDDSGDFELK